MTNYIENFTPETVELHKLLDPLPKGGYNAYIEKAEIKHFNRTNTKVIDVKFRILEPDSIYNNRIVFINIKIFDGSEKSIKFAKRLLNQICTVCNVTDTTTGLDLNNLINKSMHIYLDLYTKQNENNDVVNSLSGVGKEKEQKQKENHVAEECKETIASIKNEKDNTITTLVETTLVETEDTPDDDIPF